MMRRAPTLVTVFCLGPPLTAAVGCSRRTPQPLGAYRVTADAVHAVIAADRGTYAKFVVERLHNEDKVIPASEQWRDDRPDRADAD